ncbi:hypothetical protein [Bifidobacterium sp.]|uniref:hypothetical protein n=1 Tax=Bifidobacterium sp. TaxID=41200 RepID=UPI002A91E516|nr:hypothetical protein [Bifidobacterium sp.]MDY5367737.1 hypothetical protein [Bifidobacterium sp.]
MNTYSALWPERLGEVASAVDQARPADIVSNRVQHKETKEKKNPQKLNVSKG